MIAQLMTRKTRMMKMANKILRNLLQAPIS